MGGWPEFQCRPFNRIEKTDDGKLIKVGIDEQGQRFVVRERAWYRIMSEWGFIHIPRLYSYEPFVIQDVDGKNIFEYNLISKLIVILIRFRVLMRLKLLLGNDGKRCIDCLLETRFVWRKF